MFSLNPLRLFRKTQAIVTEAYRGASKMGKGKKLKSSSVTADFEKFENFFYQDSHVFGIITCIADSMSESGLSFMHSDKDTSEQANNIVSEYEMDTLVSELTVANMVFGNSFTVLDPAESDFDFLEQLCPRYITVQKNSETGRHEGWKYKEGDFDSALTIEQTLHIPVNRLAGSTWGTSPLQPLTRILDLKGNIEVNLDHLVTRYLVPRYVYLLGRQGTSVPQEVIDEFAKSLADPGAAQDQVFENNLEIMTMGTQSKPFMSATFSTIFISQSIPDWRSRIPSMWLAALLKVQPRYRRRYSARRGSVGCRRYIQTPSSRSLRPSLIKRGSNTTRFPSRSGDSYLR